MSGFPEMKAIMFSGKTCLMCHLTEHWFLSVINSTSHMCGHFNLVLSINDYSGMSCKLCFEAEEPSRLGGNAVHSETPDVSEKYTASIFSL
jgi:uncharacterized CHY-type Zn-finger protein